MKIFLFTLFIVTSLYSNILQVAIDNAPSGSTLKLPDGIYRGNIIINKPLTIIGKQKNAVIDGNGYKDVITITSSNVILKNLTIINSGDKMYELNSAIFINKSRNSEISNCKILNSLYGINMLMVEDSIISNNYISSKKKRDKPKRGCFKKYTTPTIILYKTI
ncbi:right-handed parallel beta-helix repeat-containing protein [Sulfurimonas sp.]|uniref:right-handed parallel beta-helix repeat-containing protein n=1 Tax=Sulfurimonas sp. TaxID=2022749 RepID=UPI002AB16FDE|nr:right-handed parallel beta-helix repeat-containing protein [Sulfurimonas sp.]